MTLCRRAGMWSRFDRARRLQQKSPNACAVRIFKFQSRHQLIGHNSRQGCCSGLGKRASAAIRDYESEIRNRVRFTTSMLQPLPSYEILHDIGQPFSILLVSITSIATASAETRPLNPKEHEETYDMPPAYIFRLETSPRMISQYGVFTSYQANVDARATTSSATRQTNPRLQLTRPTAIKSRLAGGNLTAVSPTSGRAAGAIQPMAGFTGRSPAFWNQVFRSDPVPDSNELGTFFISAFGDHFCDNIWRSTNGGQSWTSFPGTSGGDKQWFTIDKTDGPGHGFQYQFWTACFPCTVRRI